MTRAKTQHGAGKPRAPTHGGKTITSPRRDAALRTPAEPGLSKRAASVPFNELEAAIEALDADDEIVRKPTTAETPRTRRDDERRPTLPEPSRTRKPPPGRAADPDRATTTGSPGPRTSPPGAARAALATDPDRATTTGSPGGTSSATDPDRATTTGGAPPRTSPPGPPPRRGSSTTAPPPSRALDAAAPRRAPSVRSATSAPTEPPPIAAQDRGRVVPGVPLPARTAPPGPPPRRISPTAPPPIERVVLPEAVRVPAAPAARASRADVDEHPARVSFPARVTPPPRGIRLDSNDFADMVDEAPESSDGSVRKRFDSKDSSGVRAVGVGETAADDFVVEVEELPEIRSLAIAIYDEPPAISSAKGAIAVTGHKVAAAASGSTGIEQIKTLLRSGSADVLLVGVPGGEALIDTALALAPRRPVVIAACSGTAVEAVRRAASVGADLAVARPIEVERLAPVLLAATRLAAERRDTTNARGSETMLRARLDALVEPEAGALQPFELFQRVLELELKRSRRYGYPIAVALFCVEIAPPEPPPGVRGILRARAGNALIHAIRDIDMATEVDQERFLVLLPYTSLAGAAEVARRIIGAVTGGDPVVASGRTYPPKLIGAVAGAVAGQPLSFSRLMRDATQALEQARRDGAELAVPMMRPPAKDER